MEQRRDGAADGSYEEWAGEKWTRVRAEGECGWEGGVHRMVGIVEEGDGMLDGNSKKL